MDAQEREAESMRRQRAYIDNSPFGALFLPVPCPPPSTESRQTTASIPPSRTMELPMSFFSYPWDAASVDVPIACGDRAEQTEPTPGWDAHETADASGGGSSSGASQDAKGKRVSRPMPIATDAAQPAEDDIFSMSPVCSSFSSQDHVPLSPSASEFDAFSLSPSPITPTPFRHSSMSATYMPEGVPIGCGPSTPIDVSGKGKAREQAPEDTAIVETPLEVGYGRIDWPTPCSVDSVAGSSSLALSPRLEALGTSPPQALAMDISTPTSSSPVEHPILTRMPSRRRSFSNLSVHSTRSLAARSVSKIKVKLSPVQKPGNLARKLLFRKPKHSETTSAPSTPDETAFTTAQRQLDPDTLTVEVGHGSCLAPWRSSVKTLPTSYILPDMADISSFTPYPMYTSSREAAMLKAKSRTYSSPFPLGTSPLDIVPSPALDVFTPVQVPRNHFEEMLPRELQLRVLSALVSLHEVAHKRMVASRAWTAARASSSKNKYTGKQRGVCELAKLGRVSKHWQSLVFDGQLWDDLDIRPFTTMPASVVLRLAHMAGSFVTKMDMTGHVHLLPASLMTFTDSISLTTIDPSGMACTRLTSITLTGCSDVTTRSLQHLLMRSPELQTLRMRGLSAVTDFICGILSEYCPKLTVLDMSRCSKMSGAGIRRMCDSATVRGKRLVLKELRISGLWLVDDSVMTALGQAAPELQVLDLSYCRQLHNSALAAFVTCEDDAPDDGNTVWLSSREAGRDPGDPTRYRRRLTRLRHLSLSACALLTDVACLNLAHTMPHLEFLELAGIGPELREEGLIHLLRTTPQLRRLDVEDAVNITDNLIEELTPDLESMPSTRGSQGPQLGQRLEHLTISYAGAVTDDALQSLIRRCANLRELVADNTPIHSPVMRDFVRQARKHGAKNTRLVAVDCRHIGERDVRELSDETRARQGWRGYEARKLAFLDARDDEALGVGQDECDERRVVLKTFYSWQTVDAVRAAREKKRKSTAKRSVNTSASSAGLSQVGEFTVGLGVGQRARWWTPGGRRGDGTAPSLLDMNDREGCTVM